MSLQAKSGIISETERQCNLYRFPLTDITRARVQQADGFSGCTRVRPFQLKALDCLGRSCYVRVVVLFVPQVTSTISMSPDIRRARIALSTQWSSFLDIEETAFSMSKIHFNANDEGTILQSNRNARMTIQYKWTQLVKRGHLQELRKMRDNKQVLKIIRSVRNTKHGRLVWPST